MKRAGLLRNTGVSGATVGVTADALETTDASAEVLETRGEFEESLLEVEQEEDSPESLIEDAENDSDALLATVLCSAYPGNVAMRSKENKRSFKLSSFAEANMSPASVNADAHETHPWWLYCDAASTHRTYMHSTTLVHDWQIALFGGLRSKTSQDARHHVEIPGAVGGVLRRSNTLLLQLREQVTAAIAWKALEALEGGASGSVAHEAQQVAETLRQWLRVLTRTPQNTEDQDESRLVFEDDVEEPEEMEEEPEELEDEDPELVEDLSKLTVAQLKDLLKEKGLKVSGRKSELELRLEDITFTPAQLREARTRVAVLHVGGATLSSALSTAGSSAFLLLCTLTIFVKLGGVVVAVTVLSILGAIVTLPAALMLVPYTRSICAAFATEAQALPSKEELLSVGLSTTCLPYTFHAGNWNKMVGSNQKPIT
eukprot:s2577_g5.t1